MTDITQLTDEECLKLVLSLLSDRVRIDTVFVRDPDTGFLTHQVISFVCGELITESNPNPMLVPLVPAEGFDFVTPNMVN